MGLTAGTSLGQYEVRELIGAGGMGEVYRALDSKLGRDVALKVLPEAFARDPERLARFKREAKLLASLNHPNIAAIYGLEESDGIHFLVLELVPGETLAERVAAGALPVQETLKIGQQVAEALEAAHKKNITHRDIKPANIKVTPEGVVKVLDFGLAKAFAEESVYPSDAPTLSVMPTEDGRILGTPAYMSPEQAQGKQVDKQTDIWAFGCVLYELLTGQRAFPGENVTQTIAAVLRSEPEWKALPSDTPARVREILERCLEKDVGSRRRDIRDVRVELERELRGAPTNVVPKAATGIARHWKVMAPAAAAVVALLGAGYFYFLRAPRLTGPKLTDKDTVVLADFVNTTDDPVFDGTLRQGLSVQLEQSPFLSLVSEERIQRTLDLMGQPAGARLTPIVAQEICERTASAALLEGSIASLGSQYVLGLRAKNCRTGDVLDEEQVQAARKEDVLNALSQIASKFRARVGESLATVEKHNTPLAEATTPSLEALKAYTTAWKLLSLTGDTAALPFFKRAVEIDPKFAMAYAMLARSYADLEDPALAGESTTKAYQLRDRVSDREKFHITASYDIDVTGNLEKAEQTCEAWAQTYPRDSVPHDFLAAMISPTFGTFEKSVEEGKKAIELDPDFAISYEVLALNYQFLDRLGEAENVVRRASERKLNVPDFIVQRYDIAFLRGDQAEMEREMALARGIPGTEDWVSEHQAFVLAYSGHLQQARTMSRRMADQARQTAQRERAALYEAQAALREGFFGNSAEARQRALAALELSRQLYVEYGAAVALALSGDSARSQALVDDLTRRFPEDTGARVSYMPTLRALLVLNAGQRGGEPAKAIELLQIAAPYELGAPRSAIHAFLGAFYPVYVRGLAYLAAHQGAEAATEFQKILDHRGIVVSDPIGALAHLQLGRAWVLSGDKAKAKTAYQDFLTLWKDADPDIPILKQAKGEYAKLQ